MVVYWAAAMGLDVSETGVEPEGGMDIVEEARSADELLAIINAEVVGEEETWVGTASVGAP
jgi:hypothetical protein